MTHDFDDADHDSHDIQSWIKEMMRRIKHGPEGDVPPPGWSAGPHGPRGWRRRVVSALAGIVLLVLSAVMARYGLEWKGEDTHDTGDRIQPAHVVYTQRLVRVHNAPSGDSAVIRTLPAGERILATERNSRQWVQVFESDGDEIGYVYESNGNLGPEPPGVSP